MYFAGTGRYADRDEYPLPFLTLLDLKLPLKDGLEILEWLRQQPELEALRVGILTSSSEPRDLEKARRLGALFYLVKPPTQTGLSGILQVLLTPETSET